MTERHCTKTANLIQNIRKISMIITALRHCTKTANLIESIDKIWQDQYGSVYANCSVQILMHSNRYITYLPCALKHIYLPPDKAGIPTFQPA